MTKKDYELIAGVLAVEYKLNDLDYMAEVIRNDNHEGTTAGFRAKVQRDLTLDIARKLGVKLGNDNERFDIEKFIDRVVN